MSAEVAAALRLEAELERALGAFALEHAGLVREACAVSPSVTDLAPVVVTTMFGHVASRLRRLQGRQRVEALLVTLFDQMDQAEALASKLDAPPDRKELH